MTRTFIGISTTRWYTGEATLRVRCFSCWWLRVLAPHKDLRTALRMARQHGRLCMAWREPRKEEEVNALIIYR